MTRIAAVIAWNVAKAESEKNTSPAPFVIFTTSRSRANKVVAQLEYHAERASLFVTNTTATAVELFTS